ncbi:hypothetical protein V8C35DRAFT_315237, partial [Trichoderma chlorosporum]
MEASKKPGLLLPWKKRLFVVERRRILIRNQRQQQVVVVKERFPGTAQEARGAYV